jgi:hypothetical protein
MLKFLLAAAFALSATAAHANPSIDGFKNFKFDTTTVNDVVNAGGKCKTFRENDFLAEKDMLTLDQRVRGQKIFKIGTKCKMGANTVLGVPFSDYTIEFNPTGKIVSIIFDSVDISDLGTQLHNTFGDTNFHTELGYGWVFANGNSITIEGVVSRTMSFNSIYKPVYEKETLPVSNDF